jgi:ribosomal protein L33
MENNNLICPACMSEDWLESKSSSFGDGNIFICSHCKIALNERYIEAWNEGFMRGRLENQYFNVRDLD